MKLSFLTIFWGRGGWYMNIYGRGLLRPERSSAARRCACYIFVCIFLLFVAIKVRNIYLRAMVYSSPDWDKELEKLTWRSINISYCDSKKSLLSLVDLILTLPASTAECERGFSAMKRVKTDWRCRLATPTLSNMLMVLLEPEVRTN